MEDGVCLWGDVCHENFGPAINLVSDSEKIGPPGPIFKNKNGPGKKKLVRLDLHVCHVHLFVTWKTKK